MHRTRHSYSESHREAGNSKERGEREQRGKESQLDRMTQKEGMNETVNQPTRWGEFNGGTEREDGHKAKQRKPKTKREAKA